jgi:hypothetical protein
MLPSGFSVKETPAEEKIVFTKAARSGLTVDLL